MFYEILPLEWLSPIITDQTICYCIRTHVMRSDAGSRSEPEHLSKDPTYLTFIDELWSIYCLYIFFTRGQLWPSGIVVTCVCVCVYVCVRQSSVCPDDNLSPPQATITKIGPEVQTPSLRSLLFLGFIDLNLQGQIELKSQNLPHFGLVKWSGR